MSTPTLDQELLLKVAGFVDSVRDQYPGGLPASVPSKAAPETGADLPYFVWGGPDAKVIVLAFEDKWSMDEDGAPFGSETGALLQAIVSRGLGLTPDKVAVIGAFHAGEGMALHSGLCAALEKHPVEIVLCAGETALRGISGVATTLAPLRGKWLRIHGKAVMPSWSLSQIAADVALKKQFWQDIKSLLARV